jgi:hypothetical protein
MFTLNMHLVGYSVMADETSRWVHKFGMGDPFPGQTLGQPDGRTCLNCRFWAEQGIDGPDQRELSTAYPRRCCLADSSGSYADFVNTLFVAVDHEGYKAELWTKPGFGCNRFMRSES